MSDEKQEQRQIFTLTKETMMPIGLVILITTSISGAAIWINAKLNSIDNAIREFRLSVSQIEQRLNDTFTDRWSSTDMKYYIKLLQARNPELDIPSLDERR